MTLTEQKRYAAQFMKRRTSRIVAVQSGFTEQFGQDAYVHDTQEGTVNSGAPTDTSRLNPADQGIDGTVNREGGDSDPARKSDLRNAITSIQRAVENGGRGLDVNTAAGLKLLASTAQKLVELPEGVAVPKAIANPEGTTRDPLVVADNNSSSHAGSHGFIPTSELMNKEKARMEAEAAKLAITELGKVITSRVVGMTSLFEQ